MTRQAKLVSAPSLSAAEDRARDAMVFVAPPAYLPPEAQRPSAQSDAAPVREVARYRGGMMTASESPR
jgi:hypothetical protein